MSIRQISGTQYETFTGQERFNLTLAALSRGDELEATKLWQTCPWRHYSCMDMEYFQRIHAFFTIEALFFQMTVLHYNMVQKAEKFIMARECDLEAEEDQGLTSWMEKTLQLIITMRNARDSHISNLKGVIEGFRLFCVEASISHEDVLKALPLKDCCPDLDQLLAFDIPADDKHVEAMKNLFLEGWG